MKNLCFISLIVIASSAFSQSDCKKLQLILNPLMYTSFERSYMDPRAGAGINFSFAYALTNRWSIATNFMYGSFNSTNEYLNQFPVGLQTESNSSQRNENQHYSFTVQYRIPISQVLSINLATGLGWYNFVRSSQRPMFDQDGRYSGSGLDGERSGDASFPVFFSIDQSISDKVNLSLRGGFFTAPFYSTFGWNLGPAVSIKI
jgi:hypothetical protein